MVVIRFIGGILIGIITGIISVLFSFFGALISFISGALVGEFIGKRWNDNSNNAGLGFCLGFVACSLLITVDYKAAIEAVIAEISRDLIMAAINFFVPIVGFINSLGFSHVSIAFGFVFFVIGFIINGFTFNRLLSRSFFVGLGIAVVLSIIIFGASSPTVRQFIRAASESTQSVEAVKDYASVISSSLNVRSTPSSANDNNIIEVIRENTRVEILERDNNGWVRIRYGDEKTGYVYGEYLKPIPASQ